MRLTLVTLLISFTQVAFAAPKTLANFTPGDYSLESGPAEKCRPGRFRWIDQNMVMFGQHPFGTRASTTVIKSDIPQEAGCTYYADETPDVGGTVTRLTYTENVRCANGKTRHQLVRQAVLKSGQVVISVNQTGNPEFADEESYSYTCTFALIHQG